MAVPQPGKPVSAKAETRQAALGLRRMREPRVKFRTMQANSLHGLLTECGEVEAKGALNKAIRGVLERPVESASSADDLDRNAARAVQQVEESG
ncbi:putative transposase [Burkholderia thailandensis 34]|nr:putative transposase [Burkholderia thailandensis 34]AJY30057.1 putative transposase [Burkholderia thailandensis 34]